MHHAESTGAVVTWNDEISGRQFDVTIRFKYGLHDYLTVIECKDYSSKVSVEKVDAFVTKARDINANKAVLISSNGFQSGCLTVAKRHGIQLLTASEISDTSIPELIDRLAPALNIYSVRFVSGKSDDEIQFEDWGGRLAYLMSHSVLKSKGGERTPNQLIHEWQVAHPNIQIDRPNEVEIPLPPQSVLRMPLEAPTAVTAMRFTCSFVEVAISKVPLPDNHILRGVRSRIELRDPEGKVHHSARMGDLPLGFDNPVRPGRYYELSALFSRYYCESVDGDMVTWALIESYQHGDLLQAIFTQKLKYSSTYTEVTDLAILERLKKLHARLQDLQK